MTNREYLENELRDTSYYKGRCVEDFDKIFREMFKRATKSLKIYLKNRCSHPEIDVKFDSNSLVKEVIRWFQRDQNYYPGEEITFEVIPIEIFSGEHEGWPNKFRLSEKVFNGEKSYLIDTVLHELTHCRQSYYGVDDGDEEFLRDFLVEGDLPDIERKIEERFTIPDFLYFGSVEEYDAYVYAYEATPRCIQDLLKKEP